MGSCRPSMGAFRACRKLSLCTQITQNVSCEPSWEASKSQRDELHEEEHLSYLPTLLSKTPRLCPKKEPGFLHGSAGSTLQSPQALRAAGQDGTGMLRPALSAQLGSGLPAGLWHLHPALHPHPCSETPPALQLGLHCTPAEIQTGFCLNPTAWSTGNQQLLCWGCSSAKGSRVGVKHELPEIPTPLSLWISCGFVVSPKCQQATWHLQMKICIRACVPPALEPHLPALPWHQDELGGGNPAQPMPGGLLAPGQSSPLPTRHVQACSLHRCSRSPSSPDPVSWNSSLPSQPTLSPMRVGGRGTPRPGGGLAGAQRGGRQRSAPGTLAPTKGPLLPQPG